MATTRTMLATERDLLFEWYKAKQALDAAKNLESELRSKLVSASKSAGIEEGRETIDVYAESGWKLTIDHKMNYSFDFKALPNNVNESLHQFQEELNNSLGMDCILVKMEFNATNYKKAAEPVRLALAQFVTSKPGTPQVTLTEPAKKDAL